MKLGVFQAYFEAVGWLFTFLIVAGYTVAQGFSVGTTVWLGIWSDAADRVNVTMPTSERDTYLGVYGTLGVGHGKI